MLATLLVSAVQSVFSYLLFTLAIIQMSEVKDKEAEFVLVRSRKVKRCRKQLKNLNCGINSYDNLVFSSSGSVYKKILSAKDDICNSPYYSHLLKDLQNLLDQLGHNNIKEILCYGLGQFSQCVSARYQFGLLLALKDHLSAPVFVHDPIFNETEVNLLKKLHCNIIEKNEEGKRIINGTTLVYFPHCPKQLTNNFLWCNWGKNLNNCILISNSFTRTIEFHSDRFLEQNIKYILNIFPSIVEVEIKNNFKYSDIFNDLSFHIFPKENLNKITESIWNSKIEPIYKTEDLEFITQQLQKTLFVSNGSK